MLAREPDSLLGAPRRDRNASRELEKWMEPSISVKALIDHKADPARTRQLQDDRVDKGNVVRQKQKAFGGNIFRADGRDPVKQPAKP